LALSIAHFLSNKMKRKIANMKLEILATPNGKLWLIGANGIDAYSSDPPLSN
jgi:hypothetical protein